jgi:hypothetical protein
MPFGPHQRAPMFRELTTADSSPFQQGAAKVCFPSGAGAEAGAA